MNELREKLYVEDYNPCVFEIGLILFTISIAIYLKYWWYEPYNWRWKIAAIATLVSFTLFISYTFYKVITHKFCKPAKRELSILNGKLLIYRDRENTLEEIIYVKFFNSSNVLFYPIFIFENFKNALKTYIKISKVKTPTLYPFFIIFTIPFIMMFLLVFLLSNMIAIFILSVIMFLKNKKIICLLYSIGKNEFKGFLSKSVKILDRKYILTFITEEEKKIISMLSLSTPIKEEV